VLVVVSTVWILALGVVLGMGPAPADGWFANGKLFAFLDVLTAQFLLPLVSLGTAILVGWRLLES
jgi:SNF family Na+-dependent transporter